MKQTAVFKQVTLSLEELSFWQTSRDRFLLYADFFWVRYIFFKCDLN